MTKTKVVPTFEVGQRVYLVKYALTSGISGPFRVESLSSSGAFYFIKVPWGLNGKMIVRPTEIAATKDEAAELGLAQAKKKAASLRKQAARIEGHDAATLLRNVKE